MILGVAALCAAASSSQAQAPVSVSVMTSYASQYVFRGERLGGPSFQPWVEATAGDLSLGVWASTPISAKVPGQSDPELDPYASYSISLPAHLSLVPGCTLYTYPRAPVGKGFYRSRFEPSVGLTWSALGVRVTPKAYYDLARRGATYELTAVAAVPLSSLGTEADVTATAGDTQLSSAVNGASPAIESRGEYWLLGVTVPVQLTRQLRASVGWAYTQATSSYLKQGILPRISNPAAAGRAVLTVALGFSL